MSVLFCVVARFVGLLAGVAGTTRPDPAGVATGCLTAYRRALTQLGLSPDQGRANLAAFVTELVRRLPQFVTAVTVTALLPLIADRARARFRAAGESPESAEELSQEVVVRLLGALYGNWPRGNAGAFVATVCERTLCDRLRKQEREEKMLTRTKDGCRAAGC